MIEDFPKEELLELEWSSWLDLNQGNLPDEIPSEPGIYCVRHKARKDRLEYIGETGRPLRERLNALKRGIFKEKMPYRDPHTAAPCLWAVRDSIGSEFEVTYTAPNIARSERDRKGLEYALLALHRKKLEKSPTANFGRIIPGYKQSSTKKKGVRGGPVDRNGDTSAWESAPPLDWTDKDNVLSDCWMGINWTRPARLEKGNDVNLKEIGLYRIWFDITSLPLAYIGQSKRITDRLRNHEGTFGERAFFSTASTPNLDSKAMREEVEAELIGAHYLATGSIPKGQVGANKEFGK